MMSQSTSIDVRWLMISSISVGSMKSTRLIDPLLAQRAYRTDAVQEGP